MRNQRGNSFILILLSSTESETSFSIPHMKNQVILAVVEVLMLLVLLVVVFTILVVVMQAAGMEREVIVTVAVTISVAEAVVEVEITVGDDDGNSVWDRVGVSVVPETTSKTLCLILKGSYGKCQLQCSRAKRN